MATKIIISDTSCLIALDRINHLYILQELFTVIYTTSKVQEEFETPLPEWIIIKQIVDQEQLKHLENLLDAGEASAITLALETDNPTLIIDEKKGRKIATDLKIPIIGRLKVLLWAKQKGIIPSVKMLIDLLNIETFRFSKLIVDEILYQAGEI